jgi:hypothetical protein
MAAFLALLPTLIKLAPLFFKLFQSISDHALLLQGQGMGRMEAVNAALTLAANEVDAATKARSEAEADHAAHPKDDGGFDPHFRRNEP